jgi:signal transduction histidine kinase
MLPAARAATYTGVSPVDRVERVVSYRRLREFPLVVLVGLDREALLAPWRHRAVAAFVAIASIALLACALGVVVTRAARQRADARKRLAEAERLESLGRLATGVAHDFGNVLSTIIFSLDSVRRLATDDKVSEMLDRALRSAKRGTDLASQLLAFARKQPLKLEIVNVTELASGLTDFLRNAASSSADVEFDLSADVWPCRLDRTQFGIALLNLTLNACQAFSGRRGRIRLAVSNVRVDEAPLGNNPPPGQYVRVTLQDDGAGMPPEIVRRVAEPFYTTKSGGAGLGLSQVYGFVKQVGGEVTIDSEVGAGTSVHLFFPRDLAS